MFGLNYISSSHEWSSSRAQETKFLFKALILFSVLSLSIYVFTDVEVSLSQCWNWFPCPDFIYIFLRCGRDVPIRFFPSKYGFRYLNLRYWPIPSTDPIPKRKWQKKENINVFFDSCTLLILYVIWLLSLLYGLAQVKLEEENKCHRTLCYYLVWQSVITEEEHK